MLKKLRFVVARKAIKSVSGAVDLANEFGDGVYIFSNGSKDSIFDDKSNELSQSLHEDVCFVGGFYDGPNVGIRAITNNGVVDMYKGELLCSSGAASSDNRLLKTSSYSLEAVFRTGYNALSDVLPSALRSESTLILCGGSSYRNNMDELTKVYSRSLHKEALIVQSSDSDGFVYSMKDKRIVSASRDSDVLCRPIEVYDHSFSVRLML